MYKEVLCLRSIIEVLVLVIMGICDEKVKKDIFFFLVLIDEVFVIVVVLDWYFFDFIYMYLNICMILILV